jgi:hypothetical protein
MEIPRGVSDASLDEGVHLQHFSLPKIHLSLTEVAQRNDPRKKVSSNYIDRTKY